MLISRKRVNRYSGSKVAQLKNFGSKSSARQRSTLEFDNKEKENEKPSQNLGASALKIPNRKHKN